MSGKHQKWHLQRLSSYPRRVEPWPLQHCVPGSMPSVSIWDRCGHQVGQSGFLLGCWYISWFPASVQTVRFYQDWRIHTVLAVCTVWVIKPVQNTWHAHLDKFLEEKINRNHISHSTGPGACIVSVWPSVERLRVQAQVWTFIFCVAKMAPPVPVFLFHLQKWPVVCKELVKTG